MTHSRPSFGLVALLDTVQNLQRTVLPLKSLRYRFQIRGGLAEVELTQTYLQENAHALDCEYLFPLPADGAVYLCDAAINGQVIKAVVEERESARKLAAQKKAQGYRTALVESERNNLFTLSLGNIQPQDVVEIRLAYVQPLRRLAGDITFDLPLCPGVRYIPGKSLLRSNRGTGTADDTDQVPDASRITPPRITADHPDAAFIQIDGQIESGFLDGHITSPSHKIATALRGDSVSVTLARGGEVPDQDMALRWKERVTDKAELRGWVSREDSATYALVELRAPATAGTTGCIAQDIYFLVDQSGSMQGQKWDKAIEALHSCVKILAPKDRVSITLFSDSCTDFEAEPVNPQALLSDPKFMDLARLNPPGGGTEMASAISHVLAKVDRFSKDRPAVLVLITDAQVGNEGEITSLMRQHPSLPVHCFGIDAQLNDALLIDLVRQQGGSFKALRPEEDVAGAVSGLGETLRQPVLVNLQPPAGWELASGSLPNLYAGQIQFASLKATSADTFSPIQLTAHDQSDRQVTLEIKLASVTESAPRLRWAKERLVALVAGGKNKAAIALSKEANLLCPLTAFVAWDGSERVAVATEKLVQPAVDPRILCAPRMTRPAAVECLSFAINPSKVVEDCDMLSDKVKQYSKYSLSDSALDTRDIERKKSTLLNSLKAFITRIRQYAHSKALQQQFARLEQWLEDNLDNIEMEQLDSVEHLLGKHLHEVTVQHSELGRISTSLADELEAAAAGLRANPEARYTAPNGLDLILEKVSRFFAPPIHSRFSYQLEELKNLDAALCQQIEDFLKPGSKTGKLPLN